MPTISDLKDQARTLEQQGEYDKALTIYQHILKHLEGTPALAKVLPLYVKAGDLLQRMDRPEEAIASYQTAAEQYASSGAAPRVTALCGKIIRLAPERRNVYTDFVRQLIDHGHVGSARDVLADYARYAGMDRAIETLDDLAGRPNNEVQPMLERLLSSFEQDDPSEQAAERVSTQLEEVTDNLAGELSGVPEPAEAEETSEEEAAAVEEEVADDEEDSNEEETPEDSPGEEEPAQKEESDGPEPLTPPMLDLDHLPRQSSLHEAIRLEDDEVEEEEEQGEEAEEPEADVADVADDEEESGFEISRDVTPTMERPQPVADEADESSAEDTSSDFVVEHSTMDDSASGDGALDSLLADAIATEDASEASDATDTPVAMEIEGSEWKPDLPEPQAEDTVAAEWSPEEDLKPAARYPSDEYDKPDVDDESDEDREEDAAGRAESDALDDEIARAVEDSHAFDAITEKPEPPAEADDSLETTGQDAAPPVEEPTPAPTLRPSRPPRITVPDESDSNSKSPVLFGIGGLIVGVLAGAGLTFVLVGGGSPTVEQPAAAIDTPATRVETPAAAQPAPEVAAPVTQDPMEADTSEVDPPEEIPVESPAATADTTSAAEEVSPDSTPAATAPEQPATSVAPSGNPIVVDGLAIEEISEIEYRGLAGYRVVHLLDWGDPIVIEAYRDTTVTLSTRVQVNVTPPDTVVGIGRLDGYMVYASGVMAEDSLRSLMSRLVEGERPSN